VPDHVIGYVRHPDPHERVRIADALGVVSHLWEDPSATPSATSQAMRECRRHLNDGDLLVIESVPQVARSAVTLARVVGLMLAKGADVRFVMEGITFSSAGTPEGRLLNALAALQRGPQRIGIADAKTAGRLAGRRSRLNATDVADIRRRLRAGHRVDDLAREYHCNRSTLYRALNRPVH